MSLQIKKMPKETDHKRGKIQTVTQYLEDKKEKLRLQQKKPTKQKYDTNN